MWPANSNALRHLEDWPPPLYLSLHPCFNIESAYPLGMVDNLLVCSVSPGVRAAPRAHPSPPLNKEVRPVWSGAPRKTMGRHEYEPFFPARALSLADPDQISHRRPEVSGLGEVNLVAFRRSDLYIWSGAPRKAVARATLPRARPIEWTQHDGFSLLHLATTTTRTPRTHGWSVERQLTLAGTSNLDQVSLS